VDFDFFFASSFSLSIRENSSANENDWIEGSCGRVGLTGFGKEVYLPLMRIQRA
jgi:hypothetical protein